jgi:hypothetical protein
MIKKEIVYNAGKIWSVLIANNGMNINRLKTATKLIYTMQSAAFHSLDR